MTAHRLISWVLHLTCMALGIVYLYTVFSGFKPPYPSNLIMSALFILFGLVLRLWETKGARQ